MTTIHMVEDGTTTDEEKQKQRPTRRGVGLDLNELPPTRELIEFYRTKIGRKMRDGDKI